ncbi:centrin like EF hand domain-containing protein [Cryptosporidium ubiquitum]|uniref:Centrin like EF hand domain-containing protein n=1 Tax=Cryptosporidium ubiquitum TaxID=857276 RepID=A0A1J4MJC7_9CRYT|nr:centrin like EF hand domain-containing protein [Cryptosporidium ubiquitum]OII74328.1 centrin like EF hand domain-containing protein [Cryptosporidium ubiquitum]
MEIQFSYLNDFLLGKKLIPGNWGIVLKGIEKDLDNLVKDNIDNNDQLAEEVRVYLNNSKNDDKNYKFLIKLIEFLISSKEGEMKTFFGNYKSTLINELLSIKKRYQDKNLHLPEAIKEANYMLKFGLNHLEKEQREIVSKIKNTKKKILELNATKDGNIELFNSKLSSFGFENINEYRVGFDTGYFPRDKITDGIRNYYDLKLKKFSNELFEEINKLLENNDLFNLYLELIKEANTNLVGNDKYILEHIIDFPTLNMLNGNQEKNDEKIDFTDRGKENEYSIEIIDNSDINLVDDENYKDFEIVQEEEPPIQIQIFENRQLFGKLLMELYEIESFLKRYLIENFGTEWKIKLKVNLEANIDIKNKTIIDYYNLVSKIIGKLTESENYEIITFRRNKYVVIEKKIEIIFAVFNNIINQQNLIENMEGKIKQYYQDLSESQQKYTQSTQKLRENIIFLQEELKNILNKEYIIKGVNK